MPRFQLICTNGQFALTDRLGEQNPLVINFASNALQRRLWKGGKKELLLKAVGVKPGLKVWDCTAGLGTDALLMAAAGCEVVLFERSPVLGVLLQQALNNARVMPQLSRVVGRMMLKQESAVPHLSNLPLPDVLYLDPMFPARKKSARVNGQMQYLQRFIGEEADGQSLIKAALESACQRVVIKLALKHDAGFGQPSFSLAASANRFDVYHRPQRHAGHQSPA